MSFEKTIQDLIQVETNLSPAENGSQQGCALCGKPFDAKKAVTRPFCSERCQQMDLANWMDERYGLPWEDDEVDPADFRVDRSTNS